MKIVLQEGMPQIPHACVACGSNPRDEAGNPEECVFLEGVDVDWGSAVYLCKTCSGIIIQLWTGKTVEQISELRGQLKLARQELKDVKKKNKALNDKVKTILKGKRAEEEVISA
jgi:hypothetical protein